MLIGALLSLFAALCYAIGNVLQKRAVDALGTLSIRHIVQTGLRLISSWMWLAGAAISVIGIVMQIAAFQRVSISVVQSVGVAGTVLLVAVSRMHLGEKFTRVETIGLAVSIAALLMTALSLVGGETSAGRHANRTMIVIAIIATVAVSLLLLGVAERRTVHMDPWFAVASGLFYGLVGLASKGLSTLVHGSSLGSDVTRLVSSPYLYLFICAWVGALASFQSGIQRGRVGTIGPLSGAISAVYVVAVGTPIFNEGFPRNAGDAILRFAGFTAVVLGSLLLALGGRTSGPTLSLEGNESSTA